MKKSYKYLIQHLAVGIVGASIGLLIIFILKKLLHLEINKPVASIIAFIISGFFVVVFTPKVIKIPYGKISIRQFLVNLGFYIPKNWPSHLFLGLFIAAILLFGILIGSLLTNKYIFDSSTINLGQILFSLTPGVWEEVCYRGLILIVLLNATRSLKKAVVWQLIIFGLGHIKGGDLLSFIDAFSVIVVACSFTFLVIKTRSLFAAIVCHFVYDSLIFVVQNPGGTYNGFTDNFWFYSSLWISVGISIFITKRLSERLRIYGQYDCLQISGYSDPLTRTIKPINFGNLKEGQIINAQKTEKPNTTEEGKKAKHEKAEKIHRMVALMNGMAFASIILFDWGHLSPLVISGFLIGSIGNILCFLLWNKIKGYTLVIIYLLDTILYTTKGYKMYQAGSHLAYLFHYFVGFAYIIVAFLTYKFRDKFHH